MGMRSRLSGGERHQLTLFSSKKAFAHLDVFFKSLSWTNRWSGSFSWMKGTSVVSVMLQNRSASMMPLKMPLFVAHIIPAHVDVNFLQMLVFGLSLCQLISFPVAGAPILRQRNWTLVAENYIVESVTTFQDTLCELQTFGFVDVSN